MGDVEGQAPDSRTVCKEEDIAEHPDRYCGIEDQVRCFGRFGLDTIPCERTLVVETDWDRDTVTVTPLESANGCRKKELGDKAFEHIDSKYL